MATNLTNNASKHIRPANITWQQDDLGNIVPFSCDFDDVYYSIANGLAESRYVFLEKNNLPHRFCELFKQAYSVGHSYYNTGHANEDREDPLTPYNQNFTIAELGFGAGLNVLVTWQLWQSIKQSRLTTSVASSTTPPTILPRLHIISTEKYPLTRTDFARSLLSWRVVEPALGPLIDTLINRYPSLVAGVHRIHLADDVILDLWLGEAVDSLTGLDTNSGAHVDAWYLDGFAPKRNGSLWSTQIFNEMRRLSAPNSTVSTFSSAGVVKRGLSEAGFSISKAKGFGQKRQMLTATFLKDAFLPVHDGSGSDVIANNINDSLNKDNVIKNSTINNHSVNRKLYTVAVIGCGITGLMSAWSLAQRGIKVTIVDKTAPLAGASGNPRALLAPKMTPLPHVATHLHTMSYLYSARLYRTFSQQLNLPVFEATGTLDLLTKANVNIEQIKQYPDDMATTLPFIAVLEVIGLLPTINFKAIDKTKTFVLSPLLNGWSDTSPFSDNLYLPQSGLVNPKQLANIILAHSLITFEQLHVQKIEIEELCNGDETTQGTNDVHHCNQHVKLIGLIDTRFSDADDDKSKVSTLNVDKVIIASAFESTHLDKRIFDFRKIRGQLSWFTLPSKPEKIDNSNTDTNLQDKLLSSLSLSKIHLPTIPLKYNGYCAPFIPQIGDEVLNTVDIGQPTFLLGASFIRNDLSSEIRDTEHQINRDKLVTVIPQFDAVLPSFPLPNHVAWQARIGIRSQTPDYHPLVGQVDKTGLIWTLSGMGSKGYAFAPLCAEVLADQITGQFAPMTTTMLARLSPKRPRLQQPLK